ncbi:putative 35 exonuclease [Phaeomoniella chlamydospora]|uniref:Putative 35 exonuclease n=1 Tax=Phaeomoniella chlamydospora TaxID=158046 RepID=A0A0G2EEP3_PHACM|nr:putative 35 exonuclease [Phaeomoniella chlamydospora]
MSLLTLPRDMVVDDPDALLDMLEVVCSVLQREPSQPVCLFVPYPASISDSSRSSFSLLVLHVPFFPCTYLLDLLVLGEHFHDSKTVYQDIFTLSGRGNGKARLVSLKMMFESPMVLKLVFDVRLLSTYLFLDCGIQIQGVCDLGVLSSFETRWTKRNVDIQNDLDLVECVERDAGLEYEDIHHWKSVRERGLGILYPHRATSEHFGSAGDNFASSSENTVLERPIPEELIGYYVTEVKYLDRLWMEYSSRPLTNETVKREAETNIRTRMPWGDGYETGTNPMKDENTRVPSDSIDPELKFRKNNEQSSTSESTSKKHEASKSYHAVLTRPQEHCPILDTLMNTDSKSSFRESVCSDSTTTTLRTNNPIHSERFEIQPRRQANQQTPNILHKARKSKNEAEEILSASVIGLPNLFAKLDFPLPYPGTKRTTPAQHPQNSSLPPPPPPQPSHSYLPPTTPANPWELIHTLDLPNAHSQSATQLRPWMTDALEHDFNEVKRWDQDYDPWQAYLMDHLHPADDVVGREWGTDESGRNGSGGS